MISQDFKIIFSIIFLVGVFGIGACYADEPLNADTLYGVSDVLSPSLIKLTSGEVVKLIGVTESKEGNDLFLMELKSYLRACCYSLQMETQFHGSVRPLFL